jgi:hypothetical protein
MIADIAMGLIAIAAAGVLFLLALGIIALLLLGLGALMGSHGPTGPQGRPAAAPRGASPRSGDEK